MNLATGGRVTLLELEVKLNTLLGTDFSPILTDVRKGDIKHSQAGIDKVSKLLNYQSVVDFDTGLARTVEWFRSQAL